MANYLFAYVPNREAPPPAEMEAHIDKQATWTTVRFMDTLWYIGTEDGSATVTAYLTSILSVDASYLVAACSNIDSKNLPADS